MRKTLISEIYNELMYVQLPFKSTEKKKDLALLGN